MRDNGVVVSADRGLARVKVFPQDACDCCSVRSFCHGEMKADGTLRALNPVKASAGDRVEVEIPEMKYNKAFLLMFGTLLGAALVGLAAGLAAATALKTALDVGGAVGLAAGVVLGGAGLFAHFKTTLNKRLYPVVTKILGKGESHG